VLPFELALDDTQPIDKNFQSGFLGGNGSATIIRVAAGDTVTADFSPPPAGDGTIAPLLYGVSAVAPGSPSGLNTIFVQGVTRALAISSGLTMDFVVLGPGIDATLSDDNIQLFGPMSLVAGSVRPDRGAPFFVNGAQYPVVRFTANIDPVSTQSYGTIVVLANNGGIASYTGGLVLLPPPQ
jgi:hypothetical protein